MKASDIPQKFPLPFAGEAAGGFVRDIPVASQISSNPGFASLTDGFVPLNMTPIGAGGIPPFGQDMNGILRQITQWSQWQNAGGIVPYDAAFAAAIGGYPKGAIVSAPTLFEIFYVSLSDDNMGDPTLGQPGWDPLSLRQPQSIVGPFAVGITTWSPPEGCLRCYIEAWGGGGGGSGGPGASGAGGGYVAGYFPCFTGDTFSINVGFGGLGAANAAQAQTGGTTEVSTTIRGLLCRATGGTGGGSSGGLGGVGFFGAINLQGQPGTDIDNTPSAVFGGAAPRGGTGGTVNAAGFQLPATRPGGGGSANASFATGQNGAQGAVYIYF